MNVQKSVAVVVAASLASGVIATGASAQVASSSVALAAAPDTRASKKPPTAPASVSKQKPLFKSQPKLITTSRAAANRGDAGLGNAIRAKVVLKPWRTSNAHTWAAPDTVRYVLEVSKPNVKVHQLTFKARGQRNKLMYLTSTKAAVVKKAGTYNVTIAVPASVKRSLAKEGKVGQARRIRLTVEHEKDTRRGSPKPDFMQLAQSGVLSSTVMANRLGLGDATPRSKAQDVSSDYDMYNYAPYEVVVAAQPTQCVNGTTWSGPLSYNNGVGGTMTILSGGENPQGPAPQVLSDILGAEESGAKAAAAQANTLGPAAATEGGAISIGIDRQLGFWNSLLQDYSADNCKNLNSLWSNSFYAAEIDKSAIKDARKKSGGYFAVNGSGNLVKQAVPSNKVLLSQLGVPASSTWWWNGGDIQADNDGGIAFGGGIVQTTYYSSSPSSTVTSSLFYQNTTGTDGIVGPEYDDGGSITSSAYGSNPATGEKGWALNCTIGSWTYNSPWGGYSWDVASGTSALGAGGSAYFNTNWALASTTSSGEILATVPIASANPQSANYESTTAYGSVFVTENQRKKSQKSLNKQLNARVDAGLVSATKAAKASASFACQTSVGLQVPAFTLPNGWPLDGTESNFFWQSAPNPTFAVRIPPK